MSDERDYRRALLLALAGELAPLLPGVLIEPTRGGPPALLLADPELAGPRRPVGPAAFALLAYTGRSLVLAPTVPAAGRATGIELELEDPGIASKIADRASLIRRAWLDSLDDQGDS